MIIVKKSDTLYRKVEEVHYYTPSALELYFWYGGTHAGIDPNNPYAKKNSYSTRTYYEEIKS